MDIPPEKPAGSTSLQAPFLPFYSAPFYRNVALTWKNAAYVYLLLCVSVCWLAMTIAFQIALSRFVLHDAPGILRQIPDIRVTEGRLYADAPQPCRIADPLTDRVLAIIDTTGSNLSAENPDPPLLITRTNLIVRLPDGRTTTYSLAGVTDVELNKANVIALLAKARKFLAPMLFLAGSSLIFAYHVLQAVILAVAGLLMLGQNRRLSYAQLVRLSMVAGIPSLILKTIAALAGVAIPLDPLWSLLLTFFYLSFAIKAATAPNDRVSTPTRA